jgi:hypothetical protein
MDIIPIGTRVRSKIRSNVTGEIEAQFITNNELKYIVKLDKVRWSEGREFALGVIVCDESSIEIDYTEEDFS